MRVFFKCKSNGNIISFVSEGDIESTRKHEGYEEVKNVPKLPEEAQEAATKEEALIPEFGTVITAKLFKKLGRPAKVK